MRRQVLEVCILYHGSFPPIFVSELVVTLFVELVFPLEKSHMYYHFCQPTLTVVLGNMGK